MDAIELLTTQHREVEELFEQCQQASDTDRLGELASTVVLELRLHTTIEEELFYPAVRERDEELEKDVLEDLEEHHAVEMLLDELEGMRASDDRFRAKLTVISELVEHHVEEEENDQFPRVRELFGEDELTDLGQRMHQRYEDLKGGQQRDAASKDDLYRQAQEMGIEGRSQMSKRELSEAIRKAS